MWSEMNSIEFLRQEVNHFTRKITYGEGTGGGEGGGKGEKAELHFHVL